MPGDGSADNQEQPVNRFVDLRDNVNNGADITPALKTGVTMPKRSFFQRVFGGLMQTAVLGGVVGAGSVAVNQGLTDAEKLRNPDYGSTPQAPTTPTAETAIQTPPTATAIPATPTPKPQSPLPTSK